MAAVKKEVKVARSAKTGKIVSKKEAAKNPDTTVTETVQRRTKIKIPKNIGACADMLYQIREQRKEAQKVVDDLEKQEKDLKDHIINTLPKSEASGVAGKLARVSVVTKEVLQVKDWPKFYAYVKKTGSFDLLQRRLNEAAVRERLENKKKVEGIEAFTAVSVSLNKV